MATRGADVLIYVNTSTTTTPSYTAVGSQRGVDISRTATVIDASHKGNDDQEVLQGRRSSTLNLDNLYVPSDAAYAKLESAYDNQTMVLVSKYVSGSEVKYANAIVNDMSEAHPDDDVSTTSVGLTISGGWYTSTSTSTSSST
jgi:TP901-1 family phage major tail protein